MSVDRLTVFARSHSSSFVNLRPRFPSVDEECTEGNLGRRFTNDEECRVRKHENLCQKNTAN